MNWAVKYTTCDQTGDVHEWRKNLCGDISCRHCQRAFSAQSLASFVTELRRLLDRASEKRSTPRG